MFQGDIERFVWWLKQADIVTFPQISPISDNKQLQENLAKYQVKNKIALILTGRYPNINNYYFEHVI